MLDCFEKRGINVGFKKWISATVASVLLATSFSTASIANAEETRTIADESIYDLLVDRFFNGVGTNDDEVNAKDPTMFAGGDFAGLIAKKDFIKNMGYTIVSIGPVFTTEKYDGSLPTSYITLEDHFGTEAELQQVVSTYRNQDMQVMVDFPLSNVSANHEWATDASKAAWVASTEDGKIQWDLTNVDVQQALTEAVVNFVQTYDVDGIRLTNLENAEPAFINEIIATLKAEKESMYVISNEQSDADFDAKFYADTEDIYRNIFKNVDLDSSAINSHIDDFVFENELPSQIMLDNLWTNRFTLDSANENMFPPTRIKMALSSVLLLPGVPVVQYGSEIAMNGEAGTEAHQFYNFKTDSELIDYIGQLQTLRNDSETLRTGDFKWLKNEDGFLVFERKSDTETWIVVINNTGETQRVNISPEEIGEGKEIRGMFESEIIRQNKDGDYAIILDREMVEVYQVIDERGINTSYIVALTLVVVLYALFMVMIIKRGRVRRASQDKVRAEREQENN